MIAGLQPLGLVTYTQYLCRLPLATLQLKGNSLGDNHAFGSFHRNMYVDPKKLILNNPLSHYAFEVVISR